MPSCAELSLHIRRSGPEAFDDHLKVGFSVALTSHQAAADCWRDLGCRRGRRFADAVDWVSVNRYPGTWGPALGAGPLEDEVAGLVGDALRHMRHDWLPEAGLDASVALHVSEGGYPTGNGRSEETQARLPRRSCETSAPRDRFSLVRLTRRRLKHVLDRGALWVSPATMARISLHSKFFEHSLRGTGRVQ